MVILSFSAIFIAIVTLINNSNKNRRVKMKIFTKLKLLCVASFILTPMMSLADNHMPDPGDYKLDN